MTEVRLGKLSWTEVKARLDDTDVVLIPTGAIEQHGPHLPLDTDIFIAESLALRLAEAVADDVNALVAPGLPIGASSASLPFAGSLTIDEPVLLAMWEQVVKGLLSHGFRKAIIVNGHGGNRALLYTLINRVYRETGAFLAIFDWFAPNVPLIEEMLEAESRQWGHAGEIETSLMMALGGEVQMERAINEELDVAEPLRDYWPFNRAKVPISFAHPFDEWPPEVWQGVLGDARLATREKGERLLAATLAVGVDLVRNAHALPVKLKPFKVL